MRHRNQISHHEDQHVVDTYLRCGSLRAAGRFLDISHQRVRDVVLRAAPHVMLPRGGGLRGGGRSPVTGRRS